MPLVCYSLWARTSVVANGGTFFTHYVVAEGEWLYVEGKRQQLAKFDARHFEPPILDFVEKHNALGLKRDLENSRVVFFEHEGGDLSTDQKAVYVECDKMMEGLVGGSDEFVVDRYDTALAIIRPMGLAFERTNAVLGWQEKVHLVITEGQGEQSIHIGADVSLCVKEGRRISSAEKLADVLEWVLSLFP